MSGRTGRLNKRRLLKKQHQQVCDLPLWNDYWQSFDFDDPHDAMLKQAGN